MSVIVIRLFPAGGPVSGDEFRTYLEDLEIRAVDLSTAAGEVQVGQPATYTEPPDLTHPEAPDSGTRIVQHFTLVDPISGTFGFQAAATAVIEVAPPNPPAGHPEHATRDLRLEVTTTTGDTVIEHTVYMNVPEVPGGIPADRATFPGLEPTGVYLALPAPGARLDPADAYVELPSDGSPPPYADLLNAVARVLGNDPGGPLDLASLTTQQARHVAREIVWNRKFRPLPGPTGARLGALFTDPVHEDDQPEAGTFTGQLTAHQATGDADAERLTGYVVALATSVAAEARSTAATEAGLTFPVLPGQTGTGERYQQVRVLLTGLPAATRFTVPARYFYALGAGLPTSHDADQRYRSAVLADDERLRSALVAAVEAGVIEETPPPAPSGLPAGAAPVADAPPVNAVQAVRRLRALGDTGGSPAELPVTGDVQALVAGWLAETADDIQVAFWDGIVASHPGGHLDLDLAAITRGYVVPADGVPLRVKLRGALGVADAAALAALPEAAWRAAMTGDPTWPDVLPNWTLPGSTDERLTAFVQEVAKFFVLAPVIAPFVPGAPEAPPVLRVPSGDPINRFVAAYQARAGAPFVFGGAWDAAHRDGAVDDVTAVLFPGDAHGRAWLDQAVSAIDELTRLAAVAPEPARFSVAEALYARGFTSRAQVAAIGVQEFRDALVGTVAVDLADAIRAAAGGGPDPGPPGEGGGFHPVNPDGCLVDCVPPAHLSPLGPVAYLKALLALPLDAACSPPEAGPGTGPTLGELVTARRGPLGDLAVTAANLGTPLPLVDLVNESLEAVAADPATAAGAVHDTAGDVLAGQPLAPSAGGHDPATLFGAVPEHSSPAVPGAAQSLAAYAALRADAGHPLLPYVRGLDVNRSYLRAIGTCRYDVLRAFRRDITELALDPAAEPAEFRRHVWRYPVRLDLALEYLCISREEYDTFYDGDLGTDGGDRPGSTGGDDGPGSTGGDDRPGLPVWRAYGFADPSVGRVPWTAVAARVPEFLARTGLTWCDLVELWRARIVPFDRLVPRDPRDDRPDGEQPGGQPDGQPDGQPGSGLPGGPPNDDVPGDDVPGDDRPTPDRPEGRGFPECEPCDLDAYVLDLDDPVHDLRRLIVVARLWRTLSACSPCLTMGEFADVVDVLGLFDESGAVRPDVVRQLAALQMLRRDFRVPLSPRGPAAPGATGTARTPLLALWTGPADPAWAWAVETLLDHVRRFAVRRLRGRPRPPEFLEVLAANLDPLSATTGFDPGTASDTWHARPTHTLRFAEVLAKLYASDLGVGELLFLTSTADHLQGDDPFPLQPPNEAHDDPLALPDDDPHFSLWALRRRLLDLGGAGTDDTGDDLGDGWTWARIDTVLRSELGYAPAGPTDPLHVLGTHVFPSVLEREGIEVPAADRRWQVALPGSPPAMWNTPPAGPFTYLAGHLGLQLPVRPADVIAKLARIRQLTPAEQLAVRDLLAAPRAVLAPFAFLFDDLDAAVHALVEEPDEEARFAYFRRSVALTLARARRIAGHLAGHVESVQPDGRERTAPGDGSADGEGSARTAALAFRLLAHLHADENPATGPWEDDAGHAPGRVWDRPSGGAFAALLSLLGTGLVGELRAGDGLPGTPDAGPLAWRELRGPTTAFGDAENPANAPLPGRLPPLDTALSPEQGRFVAVRNGFALTNPGGEPLGGAAGFTARWTGVLLVEEPGEYTFGAGIPDGDPWPSRECTGDRRWRVVLRRGQRTWVLLEHRWPGGPDAAGFRTALGLRRGAYDLEISYVREDPPLDEPDEVRAATAGFELAYAGPDTGGAPSALPRHRLYRATAEPVGLDAGLDGLTEHEQAALAARYTGSLRDARRTYQRAFKALLLAHRLGLSAEPEADSGESELGYLLAHGDRFSGAAYYRDGGGFAVHLADLDPDLLPVADPYRPVDPALDARAAPSVRRSQAIADWWERLFDYTVLRDGAEAAPETPAWLAFHESTEAHPDLPADLLRHLGVDLTRTDLVRRYDGGPDLVSDDLVDEQWPVRIRHADRLLRQVLGCFLPRDVRTARPDLWAAADPAEPPDATSGNANLVRFVVEGLVGNGRPRRYADLAAVDDGLRERARAALLAHLCGFDRVALPWGGFATEPRHLSDLLLLDVEAGPKERASRIDEAITAVQSFVTRARLGLEPGAVLDEGFVRLWERRYARFRIWEACERRRLYRENWVDIDEVAAARRGEAFRFLEEELGRVTLTRPEPAALDHWAAPPAPAHPGLTALQVRDPSTLRRVDPAGHGFDLMGTPERGARPSWLSAVGPPSSRRDPDGDPRPDEPGSDVPGSDVPGSDVPGGSGTVPGTVPDQPSNGTAGTVDPIGDTPVPLPPPGRRLPWWVPAAIRLGTRFLRVAAAGDPPASAQPHRLLPGPASSSCCAGCEGDGSDGPGGPLVDEYWFWLVDGRWFDALTQDAGWAWRDPAELPALLAWGSEPLVRLAWSRVHAGELGPVGYSAGGVRLDGAGELLLVGRAEDSLTFSVTGGVAPDGYPADPLPGFRFDLADQAAVLLPPPVAPPPPADPPTGPLHPGELDAYPYFVYHRPGAPLFPADPFAVAVTVAATLRAHCRPEAALDWYELAFDPLHGDSSWLRCGSRDPRPVPDGGPDGTPGVPGVPAEQPRPRRRRSAAAREAERRAEARARLADHREHAGRVTGRCCSDSTVASAHDVRRRSIVLHYLETLLEIAEGLTGHRPAPESYAQARVVLETAARLLGERPRTVLDGDGDHDGDHAPSTVSTFVAHPAPPNPRLTALYDRVADRLALVRSWQTAQRLPMGRYGTDVAYLGGSALVENWREQGEACPDGEACVPDSPYRFLALAARARDLIGQVRALGAALLAACERGDAEHLAALRGQHERQLAELASGVRRLAWRDADWQVQALEKTKQVALTNRRYFADLVEAGLNRGENDYIALTETAVASHGTSIPLEAVGQAMGFIPDIWLGVAGMGPLNANQLPLGTKLAGVFATAARIAGTVGTIAGITAGERLTQAGWERREEDWRHQVEVLDIEIEQIERQILAAHRRRDMALHELNDHQLRLEQARELERFAREKLTGQALALWLQRETASLYWRGYELALRCARQAQRAFNLERGHTAEDFLSVPLWDARHEGLLAGERLDGALRRMEQAYLDRNSREYELVKNVSLRLTAPLAFLALQATGRCEIELPEWLFDLDHPGHYLRRIKSVSLSVPAVLGPYSGVNARLTLLSSTTRVSPELIRPPAGCCPPGTCPEPCGPRDGCGDCGCGCSGCSCEPPAVDEGDGYSLLPDDRRAVRDHAARDAIATSVGQSDSGMFQVDFRDERYLHFEYRGAASRWLLELPQENNQFDVSTVSDVVLHLSYTAREGGDALRRAARRAVRDRLPGGGVRVLDVEHDLPDAWFELARTGPDGGRTLPLRLSRAMFPWLPGAGPLRVTSVEFFVEAPCAEPSRHHAVRFRPARRPHGPDGRRCAEFTEVECVAGREWPGLFHGVLDAEVGVVGSGAVPLGTVELPAAMGPVSRVWLLCGFAPAGCDDRPGRWTA